MKRYNESVLGASVIVNVVETTEDAQDFLAWCYRVREEWVAIDTETTGLNIWDEDFRLRTIQFGTLTEAWVLWVEGDYSWLRETAYTALSTLKKVLAHNRPYDAQVLEGAGFRHRLWDGRDTMLMAHLLDPRGKSDGGIGHGLKDLAAHFIQPSLTDSDKALKEWAKANGVKVDDRFVAAPLRLPELERYAGLDCILARGLHDVFSVKLTELGQSQWDLLSFEHAVQRVTASMSARGFLLDEGYAHALRDYLLDREDILDQKLDALGIENPNSNPQVVDALLRAGAPLTVKTAGGDFSVSKEALDGISHPAVNLVQEHRHVTKFRSSYVDRSLELVDKDGRVHANIRSLQARTARMSVADPPLQQLPSGDPLVRRMFVADPGHVIIAADYAQVELRVLAELAQEKKMLTAIRNGTDLHTNTAELVGISRKVAKMTNFLIVYGGGAGKLAVQAGISMDEAQAALRGFHRAFPGVRRYGNRLQDRSEHGVNPVITASGRRLPLDRDRTYAATNYAVQSTARDVIAEALLELDESEHSERLLMVVHDEVVAQAPEGDASRIASDIGGIMSADFGSTFLEAEGEVYGPSWGHGYVGDGSSIPAQLKEWF